MKRSLLTLLMDLPPDALRAAAEVWGVRLTKRTHADNVALLYQAMTDRWHLEETLDALPPLAQAVAGALAREHDEGAPREALLLRLGAEPLELTDALDALRRAAIAHPQATGVWSLPREVAALIARAVRERQHTVAEAPSVAQLLASLDADVVQQAARRWQVPDAQGPLRPGDRERLLHGLQQRVANPRALAEVEAALSPGARRVVAALREEDAPLALDDATLLAGLGEPVDRRALLRELTASLLACVAWQEGARVLLMPREFRAPAAVQAALPPLVAVSAVTAAGWRHPYALAWDVLTLLRLAEGSGVRWPAGGLAALAEDHAFAAHVRPRFWVGVGAENPPSAALAFLAALARARGLLVEHESDGRRTLTLHDPVAWAKQSFAAQTRALFAVWRGMAAWPEGHGTAITLWGVDWPGFRGRLLDALAAGCQPGHWYHADALVERLARVRPALLGEGFTAASAVGPADRDELARTCAHATLRTALAWFGAVEWGHTGQARAVRLTETGWWLVGRGAQPAVPPFGATPLAIQPDLCVLVLHPEPAHLWPLLALADVETLDRVSVYRITAASLRRALRRGLPFAQVIRFLEQRAGGPLPDAVHATLADWMRAVRRVVLERAVILTADDPDTLADAVAIARAHGATVHDLPDGGRLIRATDGGESLAAWLKDADVTPVWRQGLS